MKKEINPNCVESEWNATQKKIVLTQGITLISLIITIIILLILAGVTLNLILRE